MPILKSDSGTTRTGTSSDGSDADVRGGGEQAPDKGKQAITLANDPVQMVTCTSPERPPHAIVPVTNPPQTPKEALPTKVSANFVTSEMQLFNYFIHFLLLQGGLPSE